MVYSHDERKIGKFFDEDLYEKTYIINLNTDLDEGVYYLGNDVKQIVDCNVKISKADFTFDLTNSDDYYKLNVVTAATARTFYNYNNAWEDGEDSLPALLRFNGVANYNYAMVKVQYTKFNN